MSFPDASPDGPETRGSRERPNARAPRRARPRITLKMQAIGFLSRREYSRQELRGKLLDALRKRAREDAALAAAGQAAPDALGEAASPGPLVPANGIDEAFAPPAAAVPARTRASVAAATTATRLAGLEHDALEPLDPEAAVDALLDWLVDHHYLSETRFVESRVNARSRKQGTLRIKLELARHGLVLEPGQAAELRETEFARAQALWQRKFGEPASDPRLRAKQARFLAARGFAAEVVRRVIGGQEPD